jgi:hypothetical protein
MSPVWRVSSLCSIKWGGTIIHEMEHLLTIGHFVSQIDLTSLPCLPLVHLLGWALWFWSLSPSSPAGSLPVACSQHLICFYPDHYQFLHLLILMPVDSFPISPWNGRKTDFSVSGLIVSTDSRELLKRERERERERECVGVCVCVCVCEYWEIDLFIFRNCLMQLWSGKSPADWRPREELRLGFKCEGCLLAEFLLVQRLSYFVLLRPTTDWMSLHTLWRAICFIRVHWFKCHPKIYVLVQISGHDGPAKLTHKINHHGNIKTVIC